ncbi:hypothetical protein RHMOL_Rhmol03G0285000 [Rhododendron molle]|uniref:Uncharacterized protein n=1 Tax=Rhododendron molle TaxID=49168 RepID=A0ACC0PJ39_RHOML|nr:hypothetical protein RHMOL_Rhmol03G0285000 [Rhododendron molle]
MERVYQNHPEVTPASDSDEDSQYYIMRNEPSNHIGSVQYFGSNYTFPPIQYGQMPVLQHPVGCITNTYPSFDLDHMHAANFLPYGSQYSYSQQPLFQRDPRKFQYRLFVAKNFYNRGGPAARYSRGQHIQRPFDGNSHWFRSGDDIYAGNQSNVHTSRVYSCNEGHSFTDSCFFPSSQANANFSALNQDTQYGCYSLPGYTSGGDLADDRGVQNTYHGENSTQSNILSMVQGSMQQNFPLAEDYSLNGLSKGADGDTGYISEDTDRDFEGCDAATKLVGQDHSQQQYGYKDGVGTYSPDSSDSSVVSSTLGTSESTIKARRKGQRRNTPRNKSIQSIRDHAPQIRVGNRKASIPRLVYLKKIKAQLAARRSRTPTPPSTPIHHITWDGMSQMSLYCPYLHFSIFNLAFYLHYPSFPLSMCDIIVLPGCDEESEPAGQSCPFCDKDLLYAPTDDDEYEYTDILIDEPPKLPAVAVLSCGHFFHSQCLELNIPEELSTDPPCFLCLSYGERS